METIAKIRRYYFVQGKKIREISRELNLSRNTVRKVVRSGETAHHYNRSVQHSPKLGSYINRLDELLEQESKKPVKERLTAQRLYELIQVEGYEGAYDSVRRYVKKWKESNSLNPSQCYIPLQFSPGEAYQFDWSHEKVIISGVAHTIKVAHFRLCYSRMFFVAAYPRESREMVFDAHNKAFAFFKGTCIRGIYDNLKTVVNKILHGKEREFNSKFLQLCSHYLIEPVACTPGAGWEKGQVENQVRNIRRWLFTPRPRFSSLKELNLWLSDRCIALSQEKKHPEFKDKTVWEVFEEEQQSLIQTHGKFEAYSDTEVRVSRTSLVRYDRNHYSIDSKYAGKTATIRAYADRIKVISNGHIVADHVRQFSRDKVVYDPWHYLNLLERKPGAIRNGAPFSNWQLPPSVRRVMEKLSRQPGGDREFVSILIEAQKSGLGLVDEACRQAIADKTIRGEVILNIITRLRDPSPVEEARVPDSLTLTTEPIADCELYDSLRKEVIHGAP